jgi:hypothetical protein
MEELMELERKTIQSEAAPRVNTFLVGCSGIKKKHETELGIATQELLALLDDEPENLDFESVMTALVNEWEKLQNAKASLDNLSHQLDDIQSVRGVNSLPKMNIQVRREKLVTTFQH